MPKTTIKPNENIRLKFSVPDSGLVEFDVLASRPVMTYIVRPKGLELFDSGSRTFRYYGGFPAPRKEQHQEVRLPFDGSWYLLIINPSEDDAVRVEYEVRY